MDRTSRPAAGIVGIVGGAALIIGSLLTWVTLAFDSQRFAQAIADALHVDVSQLGTVPAVPSSSQAGTASDGRYTIAAGVVVLVFTILLLVRPDTRSVTSKLLILGGVVGAGVPLYDVLTTDAQLNGFIDKAGLASELEALGLSTAIFKDAVSVTWGIGVWVCVVGGVIAVVAGIMAARSPAPAVRASDRGSGWAGDDVVGMPPPSIPAPSPAPPEDPATP